MKRSEIQKKVRLDHERAVLSRKLSIERGRKALLRVERESGTHGVLAAIHEWLNNPHYGPVS